MRKMNESYCNENNRIILTRKRQLKRNRILLVLSTLFLAIGIVIFISFQSGGRKEEVLRENIYASMTNVDNRTRAYNKAVALNNGVTSNTCVYFLSEVLRMNGVKIQNSVCNTTQLLDIMKRDGWKREYDYKKLKPGDICFTTDGKLNKKGVPTHVYVFMGWKDAGNYDYAYICDNQAKDYGGKVYHLRNISKVDMNKGEAKEPFSFFMYK